MSVSNNAGVVVVGALHVDEIATSVAPLRLGESNPVNWHRYAGGVGSNVARSAHAALEQPIWLITNCGNDANGLALQAALENNGVTVLPTDQHSHATGRYTAVLQPDGDVLVGLADVSQAEDVTLDQVLNGLARASVPGTGALNNATTALVLDGNLDAGCLQDVAKWANQAAGVENSNGYSVVGVCVSPNKAPRFLEALPDLTALFCNQSEAHALTTELSKEGQPNPELMAKMLCHAGCAHVVLSLGVDGVWVVSGTQSTHLTVESIDNPHTLNGPGDALTGASVAHCAEHGFSHEHLIYAVQHVGIPAAQAVITGKQQAPQL